MERRVPPVASLVNVPQAHKTLVLTKLIASPAAHSSPSVLVVTASPSDEASATRRAKLGFVHTQEAAEPFRLTLPEGVPYCWS